MLGTSTRGEKIKAGAFVRAQEPSKKQDLVPFLKKKSSMVQGTLQTFLCECHRLTKNLNINDIHSNHAYI